MSRRHHGNRPHRIGPRPDPSRVHVDAPPAVRSEHDRSPRPSSLVSDSLSADPTPATDRLTDDFRAQPAPMQPAAIQPATLAGDLQPPGGMHGGAVNGGPLVPSLGCTAPQLRRFIKSRPYVPMHELRRRFGINGGEDDVTLVSISGSQVFVGLPPREGALLGELLRGGEIGYELSLDPRSPIVVGLYPMRPVARS